MKREEQRVLAGSLNVLTPSDKTPENDAIELINFRVDQAGVLRVADSFYAWGPQYGDRVHTLFELGDMGQTSFPNGGTYDVVFPESSLLIGSGTSLGYYPGGSGDATFLADGFDGYPLGIVVWNGFIWIMNAAQQIKLNPVVLAGLLPGNPVESWLPAPPTTPCVAAADTGFGGGPVGTYNYYCTYTGFNSATGATEAESSGTPSGDVTAEAGIVSVTGLPGQGLYLGGALFSPTPLLVTGINLYRSGGTLSGTRLVQAFGGLEGEYPLGLDFPSTNTPYWDTSSDAEIANAQQMPAGGAGALDAPTSGPTVVGGPILSDATEAVGTYSYYVTYVNDAGLETNPGPESNFATSVDGQIVVSSIPVSPDATVWARRLYREGGTLGQAYQVTQISDNTTTAYVDGASDLALTELGIAMPGSDATVGANDPPPAALGLVGPYFNYLLAFQNNRMFWSQNGVPLFPGSSDNAIGNWVNVGSPDDHIMGITFHTNVALIYKQRSVWRLLGDPVSGYLLQTSATIGAPGPSAIANSGSVDYFLSTDGLFLYDLDVEHKQSGKLDPIFLGVPEWTALGASDLPLHRWNPSFFSVCAWLNGTVLLSDGDRAGTTWPLPTGNAFLFHAQTQRFSALATNFGEAITAVATYGSAWEYYIGDIAGNVGSAQPYTAIPQAQTPFLQTAVWQTRFLDQGLGDQPKAYCALVLDAELNGATANVYAFFNASGVSASGEPIVKANGALAGGALAGTARQKFYINLENEAFLPAPHISVRVEIACAAGTVPPAIHGLYIYYYAEARETTSMITLPFALDPERGVWQVKEIEYDAAVNGAIAVAQVSIDQPGNVMTVAETDTLPVSNYRRNYQLPMNTLGTGWYTARLFQLYLSSAATFRLYAARMLARKVGTFVEGYEAYNASGGFAFVWDSYFLNFGSPQVKIFDQIKLEIETASVFQVSVSTELPGETPIVQATADFAGTGARQWFTVNLPTNTIGRDIRVQISALGTWTFYAGKVSMRVAGRYLSTAQGDELRTLDQDFGSERVKVAKKLEVDFAGDLYLQLSTDEPNGWGLRATRLLSTGGDRQTMRVILPPNVRGRLWRLVASAGSTTTSTAFVYALRVWMRVVGESGSVDWAWQEFALEPSETLPRWADLPVAPTPSDWVWVPVPLAEPLDSAPPATAMLPYAG